MNKELAESRLGAAHALLDHIEGRNKKDREALGLLRKLVEGAIEALGEEDRKSGVVLNVLPRGCVEGRANVRRGDWR